MRSRDFFEIALVSAMSVTAATSPASTPARRTIASRPYFALFVSTYRARETRSKARRAAQGACRLTTFNLFY